MARAASSYRSERKKMAKAMGIKNWRDIPEKYDGSQRTGNIHRFWPSEKLGPMLIDPARGIPVEVKKKDEETK